MLKSAKAQAVIVERPPRRAASEPFNLEEDMLPITARRFQGMLALAELPLEHGRPDLLVLQPNKKAWQSRLARFQERTLTPPAVRLLNDIGYVEAPISSLGVDHNMGAATVAKHLRALRHFGLITVDDKLVRLGDLYQPPFDRIHAIELKISNWAKAKEQTLLHASFADYVSIAIDAAFVHRVDRAELAATGVGLIQVRSDGIATILQRPRRLFPHDAVLRRSIMERAFGEAARRGAASTRFHESAATGSFQEDYLRYGS